MSKTRPSTSPDTACASPKRILVAYWGRYGAGGPFATSLAESLAKEGRFEVVLSLSRQAERSPASDPPPYELWPIDTFTGLADFALQSLKLPWIAARFARQAQLRGIDTVLVAMPHVWDPVFQRAARRAGMAWVTVAHDAVQHPGERARLLDWLQGRELAEADAVVTLSRHVATRLIERRRLDPSRVITLFLPGLRHGAVVAADRPHRPFRFLFFGRLLPYKGLDLLLEAFARLRARGIEAELAIVGDGAVALPPQPGLRVERGWVAPERVGAILAGADALVLPYREASQSGVIATAQAAGLPSIATPVGGLAEQIVDGETGLVASAIDAVAIEAAMISLATDPILYRRCLEGVRVAEQTRGWPEFARQLGDALFRLVLRS